MTYSNFFYKICSFFNINIHTISPLFIVWSSSGEITLKYKKCPRCQLNYIRADWEICSVCQDELNGKKSIFDTDEVLLCPYCNKRTMDVDEIMCWQCQQRRNKRFDE